MMICILTVLVPACADCVALPVCPYPVPAADANAQTENENAENNHEIRSLNQRYATLACLLDK
jgi:hypothetical protein